MDFLRYCELTVGPLADWQGGGPDAQALKIRADGTAGNLRVTFSAAKSIGGDPNKTEVTIYNLSANTRQAMRGNLTRVQVVAGYDSNPSGAAVVAVGALSQAVSVRQGADIVTKLTVLDGFGGMVRGAVSRSYSGSTQLEQVVREAAATMPGIKIDKVQVVGRLPGKGIHLAGPATSQLNKLADQFGFSWSIQNGVLQAVMDDADTGDVWSFSSANNLISCTPLLNGPTPGQSGIEITAKFEARPKPGDRMVVQSSINPRLSGTYKATSVTLNFDSHGPATLQAQCVAQ